MKNQRNNSRILILTDSLASSSGGLGIAAFRLACEAARSMPDCNFLLVGLSDTDCNCVQPCLAPPNLDVQIATSLRINGYALSWDLFRILITFSPDIIHVRGLWRLPSLASLLYKIAAPSKQVIVQPAGMLEPWSVQQGQHFKHCYFRYLEGQLFIRSSLVHATSCQERNNLVKYGIDSGKILVVSSGVDIPSINVVFRKKPALPRRLLFLSRLHPKKGLDLLLEALTIVGHPDWECVIAGSGNSSYTAYLKSQITSLNLTESVRLIGKVLGPQKEAAFASSHAFILPTLSENFGIAIAEAMSWALPVITTTGTPWSCLKDEDMGWYVEPTVESISTSLRELFASTDEQLLEMGIKARRKIESNYSWEAAGHSMALAYSELITSSTDASR